MESKTKNTSQDVSFLPVHITEKDRDGQQRSRPTSRRNHTPSDSHVIRFSSPVAHPNGEPPAVCSNSKTQHRIPAPSSKTCRTFSSPDNAHTEEQPDVVCCSSLPTPTTLLSNNSFFGLTPTAFATPSPLPSATYGESNWATLLTSSTETSPASNPSSRQSSTSLFFPGNFQTEVSKNIGTFDSTPDAMGQFCKNRRQSLINANTDSFGFSVSDTTQNADNVHSADDSKQHPSQRCASEFKGGGDGVGRSPLYDHSGWDIDSEGGGGEERVGGTDPLRRIHDSNPGVTDASPAMAVSRDEQDLVFVANTLGSRGSIPDGHQLQTKRGSDKRLSHRGSVPDSNCRMNLDHKRTESDKIMAGPSSPRQSVPFRRQLSKRKSEVLLGLETVDEIEPFFQSNFHGGYQNGINVRESNQGDEMEGANTAGNARNTPQSPRTPKARKIDRFFDPYQIFQVQNAPCLIFQVRVLRGRNITMGLQDYYDTPDPYVYLHMPSSPEGRKQTSIKTDNPNPVWNEEFMFYINFTHSNILEIRLMESNLLWFDQQIGSIYFDVCDILEMDRPQCETFVFNKVCEVDIEFLLYFDKNPTLRYSLCLSDQEKEYQEARKNRVMKGLKRLLGNQDGPANTDEVPTIAVIGSGGGFRAMTAYSGVFKALVESGLLDCVTYAGGLSGSSWFLSTLYSHPKWPDLDMSEFLDELMNSMDKNLRRFFNPSTMYEYASCMVQKRREGQPVSLTDIFGRLVGETLLKGRMDVTLTDQREKIKDGHCPMPLYTCVHVKKDVPARSFQEWVEFSPYEIGMPKYGTFMDSSLFGSKFFMGKLVKQFQEQPLHFLQGIWGSAFCILFKRLFEDNRRIDPAEMIRQEMGEQLEEAQNESSSDCSDSNDSDDSMDSSESFNEPDKSSESIDSSSSMTRDDSTEDPTCKAVKQTPTAQTFTTQETDSAYDGEMDDEDDNGDDDDDEDCKMSLPFSKMKQGSLEKMQRKKNSDCEDEPKVLRGIMNRHVSESQNLNCSDGLKKSVNFGRCPKRYGKPDDKRKAFAKASLSTRKSRSGSKSYWRQMMKAVCDSESSIPFLNSRQGRAAVIHNFMRGLSLQQTYPLSPFTPVQDRVKAGDEFDGIFEMHPTSVKHIYMVDAGLTFNSPYPLVLRPQREVDIILSFDFTARPSDNHQPFKELLLAEKWANLNRLPFPPIDLSEYERDGMKELYIFKHPTDPHCPVVLHFVLINKNFKYYSKPGVARETKEEFDFADFDIFDDPEAPYSTFNFTYTHKSFQRLSQLTEFNTLSHLDDVKKVFKERILSKRANPSRYEMASDKETFLLSMKSVLEMKKKMHRFMKRLGSTISHRHSSSPTSPSYVTATPGESPGQNPFFAGYRRNVSHGSSTDGSVFNPTTPDMTDYARIHSQTDHEDPCQSDHQGEKIKPSQLESSDATAEVVSSGNPHPHRDYSQTNGGHSPPFPNHNNQSQSATLENGDTSSSSHDTSTNPFRTFHESPSTGETHNPTLNPALKRKKKSPPNLFFAHMPFLATSSSSSSQNTGSPDSVNYRRLISNPSTKKDKNKLEALKNANHTDYPPLAPEVMRLRKEERVFPRKTNSLVIGASPQSSGASSPSTPAHKPTTTPSPDQRVPHIPPSSSSPSSTSSTPSSRPPLLSSTSSEEIFSLAPQAFKSDGTPVYDQKESKQFYDEVKEKRRKMFRHQSTVSSLSCMSLEEINEYYYDCPGGDVKHQSNCVGNKSQGSLDSGYNSIKSGIHLQNSTDHLMSNSATSSLYSGDSNSSAFHPGTVNFENLSQFQSIDRNVKAVMSNCDSIADDDDEEEEWFDTGESVADVE